MTVDFAHAVDDGAYDHLTVGAVFPDVSLPSTTGGMLPVVDPSAAFTVLYVYPATGVPGVPMPEGWLEIPGAFGCTAQSCSYRDLVSMFADHGAVLRGVSTQTTQEQQEFAARERVPYPLLSDADLTLATAVPLPTFDGGGVQRLKRSSLILRPDRRVEVVRYPIVDPASDAQDTLAALRTLVR